MIEDSSQQRCKKCDEHQATHMCEDCGITICTECIDTKSNQYIICRECHHNLGTPAQGEKFESCPECESEDLSAGRRVEEICPRCHSSRIINIEEKRRTLAHDLRHAIMSLHHGHTKLRDFNNQLTFAKRLLVSLRMASFLHYNWLEDKLESLNEEVVAIKSRVSNQAEIVTKRMVAETKGLMDNTSWTTAQFPFIEGVTQRVSHIGDQYQFNVEDALREARITLQDIMTQLEGLDYYRKKFANFYDVSELSVNELPVCALPDIKVTGSNFLRHDKATGTLHITNKRLVFVAETGFVRKKMDVVFDFPLMYLKSIEEDGRIRKRLVFKMKQGDLKISCSEQTEKVLSDYIEIARKFERYVQTDLQRVRKLEQNTVNVSDVRLKIEGLVYSLLNPVQYGRRDRFGLDEEPSQSSVRARHFASGYESGKHFPQRRRLRDELERTWDQRHPDDYRRLNPDVGESRDNVSGLEKALSETVHLLRNGRIVPEDFIRRYKGLMRDSYSIRKRVDRDSRDLGQPQW